MWGLAAPLLGLKQDTSWAGRTFGLAVEASCTLLRAALGVVGSEVDSKHVAFHERHYIPAGQQV